MRRLAVATTVALTAAGACLWVGDWALKRLLLWVITMLVALNSGCTFAYVPGDEPRLRVCMPPRAWQCDPRYEWGDM